MKTRLNKLFILLFSFLFFGVSAVGVLASTSYNSWENPLNCGNNCGQTIFDSFGGAHQDGQGPVSFWQDRLVVQNGQQPYSGHISWTVSPANYPIPPEDIGISGVSEQTSASICFSYPNGSMGCISSPIYSPNQNLDFGWESVDQSDPYGNFDNVYFNIGYSCAWTSSATPYYADCTNGYGGGITSYFIEARGRIVSIDNFTAPSSVNIGDQFNVNWQTDWSTDPGYPKISYTGPITCNVANNASLDQNTEIESSNGPRGTILCTANGPGTATFTLTAKGPAQNGVAAVVQSTPSLNVQIGSQPPGNFTLSGSPTCTAGAPNTDVNLSWTPSSGASYYDIHGTYGIPGGSGLTVTSFEYPERLGVHLTYYVTAVNSQGSTNSNTIDFDSCPAPSVSISASPSTISSGGSSVVSWSSTNANQCSASGSWSGSKAVSGTYNTGSLSSSQTYTISCSATGAYADTVSASVNVTGSQVSGECGTANKTYSAGSTSYGSDTFCLAGSPSPSSLPFPSSGSSTNWTCLGSNGGSNSPQCTASLASGSSNTLTVTLNPSNGGSVTSSPAGINCGSTCSSAFSNGTVVTLTPTPASSYWQFAGWSGDCSGTGTCILTLSAPKAVTATFNHRVFNYIEF